MKHTKNFTVKRASHLAKLLSLKYKKPALIEVACWYFFHTAEFVVNKQETPFKVYIESMPILPRYLDWEACQTAVDKLLAKEV
jgi:hypothetical protein